MLCEWFWWMVLRSQTIMPESCPKSTGSHNLWCTADADSTNRKASGTPTCVIIRLAMKPVCPWLANSRLDICDMRGHLPMVGKPPLYHKSNLPIMGKLPLMNICGIVICPWLANGVKSDHVQHEIRWAMRVDLPTMGKCEGRRGRLMHLWTGLTYVTWEIIRPWLANCRLDMCDMRGHLPMVGKPPLIIRTICLSWANCTLDLIWPLLWDHDLPIFGKRCQVWSRSTWDSVGNDEGRFANDGQMRRAQG